MLEVVEVRDAPGDEKPLPVVRSGEAKRVDVKLIATRGV
jgi:hypothetical protein